MLLVVLALGVGGYTYAKYRTALKGGGQIDVAKWSFKVNDNSKQIETIKLMQTVDERLLANGKVAPGTGGEFTINIDGTGTETGINYEVEFQNEQNKPTNLIFIYEGQEFNTLSEVGTKIIGNIPANATDKTKKITIVWQWKYETGTGAEIDSNDEIDTREGIEDLNYTFDVVVTGTQVPVEQN